MPDSHPDAGANLADDIRRTRAGDRRHHFNPASGCRCASCLARRGYAEQAEAWQASAIQAEARVAELEAEAKALADDRGALMQAVMRETARAVSLRASCEAALAMLREDRPKAALALFEKTLARPSEGGGSGFQAEVDRWMQTCFGAGIASDRTERNFRFLEEALELAQANACSRDDAAKLVDYVYGRPAGELRQEVGGVMVTLAALCTAAGLLMEECGDEEVARVWTCIDKIRAKQAAKVLRSPLPGLVPAEEPDHA